jgi:putative flippase GtrA
MDLSPTALREHIRSEEGRKQLRYAGVSLFFVPVGQVFVQIIARISDSFTVASIVASGILTLPNFFANRHFVWRVENRDNMRTQVLVFWVAAMLGVTLATLLTFLVEQLTEGQDYVVRAGAAFVAQMTGFGIVWVGRYLLLDKWLFRMTHEGQDPPPDVAAEMHSDLPI